MKNTISNIINTGRNTALSAYTARRQARNYERFMQERAGIFQVTEQKEQAMFWCQNVLAR